ncbi:MAG: CocE/NonD family hydrolase, partial [Planctomycetota bacterium]|nr:CocE/NonD family hydrolase [Planctomycetota bacterium]
TGLMDEPAYRVWMQESLKPEWEFDRRPGRWIAEEEWPSKSIRPQQLFLSTEGLIESEVGEETELRHRSPQTTGRAGGLWCPHGDGMELPPDQNADDAQSLCFESEPLENRIEILGAPSVTLELSIDRPAGFIAVRLCDVDPDGASSRVTFGLLNLTHRHSHEFPDPVRPGERMTVNVQLNDIAHAFPSGHRIRLAISTAYWPMVWPSPENVKLTVFTGASFLEMPNREPRKEDEDLRAFDPPESYEPIPTTLIEPGSPILIEETKDSATGECVFIVEHNRGRYRLEDTGLELASRTRQEFRIQDNDPLTASIFVEGRTSLARDDWTTRIDTRTKMGSTKEHFLIDAELEAFEGTERVFGRNWEEEIERKGV